MTTETDRVDLLTVAGGLADSLDLPPIGSKDPVHRLEPPGVGYTWLELASRPGLAEALVLALAAHLETLPGRPRVLYLTPGGFSCEPGFGGHRYYSAGWYQEPLLYDADKRSIIARAIELNDRLLAAPGMSD